MEVNGKKLESLIQRFGLLLVEAKSLYNEIYTLLPEIQKLDKKKKRQGLEHQMRQNLIKTAKIKS